MSGELDRRGPPPIESISIVVIVIGRAGRARLRSNGG